jgi:hypothetical protein
MASSIQVSSIEACRAIDRALETSENEEGPVKPRYDTVPRAADEISSVLVPVSPILDDMVLYQQLSARSELGKFQTSIGSTDAPGNDYIIEDDATKPSTDKSDDDESEDESDDRFLDEIYKRSTRGEIDFDQHFVSVAHAKRHGGVDAGHLSKVWKIDLEAAQGTLGVTTQQSQRTDNPNIYRPNSGILP